MHIRSVSSKFAILVFIWALAALPLGAEAQAQAQDPLPSWNDGTRNLCIHFYADPSELDQKVTEE